MSGDSGVAGVETGEQRAEGERDTLGLNAELRDAPSRWNALGVGSVGEALADAPQGDAYAPLELASGLLKLRKPEGLEGVKWVERWIAGEVRGHDAAPGARRVSPRGLYSWAVSTIGHVLAFVALMLNLLLGGIIVTEYAGVVWRDVFEFVMLGLYLMIVWGMPGSLRPRGESDPNDDVRDS